MYNTINTPVDAYAYAIAALAELEKKHIIFVSENQVALHDILVNLNFFNCGREVLKIDYGKLSPLYSGSKQEKIYKHCILREVSSAIEPKILLITPYHLALRHVKQGELSDACHLFYHNESLSLAQIIEIFYNACFERVETVYSPGEFAIRGGIVDFSSVNTKNQVVAYRINIMDGVVNKINSLDLESQISLQAQHKIAEVIPADYTIGSGDDGSEVGGSEIYGRYCDQRGSGALSTILDYARDYTLVFDDVSQQILAEFLMTQQFSKVANMFHFDFNAHALSALSP